jgi:Cellulose binding domain
MLMTPWLAAGVGVVVAAVLALNVPRAALTYSQANPGVTCQAPSCDRVSPRHQHGGLAAKDPGIELKHRGRPAAPQAAPAMAKEPAAPAHARRRKLHSAGAPADVRYQTLQRWPSGFTGLITIMSRATLSGWRLAFKYPGAHIDSVTGAKWNARGDGGVASAVPWPWSRPPGNVVRIMIVANGTPGQPTACRFDGAPCSFG